MAPEYAMQGNFSVKSDVYSFGVLLLEIVSGQKNYCFNQVENVQDLLNHVSSNILDIYFVTCVFVIGKCKLVVKLSSFLTLK